MKKFEKHCFKPTASLLDICANVCMLERTHEKDNQLCVLRSLHSLSWESCQQESTRLQQANHAMSAKHLVNWDYRLCLNARTQM